MRNLGRALHNRLGLPRIYRRLSQILYLTVVGGLSTPGAASTSEIELHVSLLGGSAPQRVEIIWNAVSRSTSETAPRHYETSIEAPGSVVMDLEPTSVWQLSIASHRFWAAPEIVSVSKGPGTARLELWPTTRVVGQVEAEQNEEIPPSVELRFESSPKIRPKIERASVTCPVQDGRYQCALPATRLDLRLRAEGFISHYFWDAELEAETHRLGTSVFRHGASIVGWVEMEDSSESFDDAVVTLSLESASATMSETTEIRRSALDLAATVNPRGFFELVGVPEGLYAVTVEHPAFAPGRYAPIQVLTNAEAELYPIPLRKALALGLSIRPARPDASRGWGVELFQLGQAPGHLDLAAVGVVGKDGTWSRAGLTPGEYVLRITDGPETVWHREDLLLPAGAETIEHQVDLPGEELVGQVLLGSEPLAAELYFGTYHGAVRIPARSDPEGKFETYVPLRESWTIDVHARGQHISQRFQDVSPQSVDEEGRRWLELVVPATTVEGTVVDSQSRPVENARIHASGRAGGQTQRSKGDGSFALRGLRPGKYWLRAKSRDRRSAMIRIEVEVEEPSSPVELVLETNRQVTGQVIGPSGRGVVGTKIVGLIEQSAEHPVAFEIPEAVTDLTGSFSLELPDLAEGVILTVFPPGFATRQVRVSSRSQEPILISVEPHGGTLKIRYDEPVQRSWLVIFNPRLLPPHFFLTNWAQLHGEPNTVAGEYSVPMLESGYYQVCTDPQFKFQLTGRLDPELESRCSGGLLPPYGQLVLDVR